MQRFRHLLSWLQINTDTPFHTACRYLKNNKATDRHYNSEKQQNNLLALPYYSPDGLQHIALSSRSHRIRIILRKLIFQFTVHSLQCNYTDLVIRWCFRLRGIPYQLKYCFHMHGLEERRVEWDVSLRDPVGPMWSGFKGHGSDVIIHPLGFLRHEKYLPRSVIITVALLWTPSCTRLATPLQSTVLFPSKDAAAIHLCVIIGSSAYEVWINENRRALHHERFLYQLYKRRAPCHLTFVTSPS